MRRAFGRAFARRNVAVLTLIAALVLVVGSGTSAEGNTGTGTAELKPFSIALEGSDFIQNSGQELKGSANIGARLKCRVSATVNIRFRVLQWGAAADDASLNYPCTAGASVHVMSDFLDTFSPGPAAVFVTATALGHSARAGCFVWLASWQSTVAYLRYALHGPHADEVAAELRAALIWRSQYNPKFHIVWIGALHPE